MSSAMGEAGRLSKGHFPLFTAQPGINEEEGVVSCMCLNSCLYDNNSVHN